VSVEPAPASVHDESRRDLPTARTVLRVVLIVVASTIALYLLYRLREPILWILIALFISVCASGPVNALNRRMPRGLAIAIVYLGIVLVPIGIAAILIPPVVEQSVELANDLPQYAQDLQETFEDDERLRELDEQYDLTQKLQDLGENAASRLGDAAGALADIGAGFVNLIFALVTILVLSIYMVSRGRSWVDLVIATRPAHEQAPLRQAVDRMARAVGSYVGGALAQAFVAGVAAFIMLTILGVPSPLPLAVVMAILDLIPLVGATLGAIIVGIVTAFADFPVDTIAWALFAIAYQQVENYVIQPRIQSRAVNLDPFTIVIAAIFGATLLGVVGALLAIPTAAAIQIALKEYVLYRREMRSESPAVRSPTEPAAGSGPGSPVSRPS
jgi:predicted PurR-regulated permease PerM